LTRAAALAAVLLALGAAGCGSDKEKKGGSVAGRPPERTAAQETATEKTNQTGTGTTDESNPQGTSPESQPGGAGDEAPNRAPAMFTGRGGRITPRLIQVPPFIAVRVELRSADSRPYGLRFGRKTLRVGPQVSSAATSLDGLHQGQTIVGRPIGGGGNTVRIEASAEPGP
jgi:hypothetical protein